MCRVWIGLLLLSCGLTYVTSAALNPPPPGRDTFINLMESPLNMLTEVSNFFKSMHQIVLEMTLGSKGKRPRSNTGDTEKIPVERPGGDLPAPSEGAVPSDATPAPSDATPAPSDATPAPSEATPAPSEGAPAPSEEAPTPAPES